MRLLLIRHGQTPSNVAGVLDTAVPGPDLTDLGRDQAAALDDRLADEAVDAVYASPLIRTQRTVAPLAGHRGLSVTIADGLREIDAGDLAMHGDTDSIRTYLMTVFAWARGEVDQRIPGGENGVEALGRLDRAVADIAGAGHETAIVGSHGAAIRLFTAARTKLTDVGSIEAYPLPNTGIVVLDGSPDDGWRLEAWLTPPGQ